MATIIGTRRTRFYLDSTEFTAEVSRVILTTGPTDSNFQSFAEALAGGARDYKLVLTLRQDTAAAALWYYMWDEAGDDQTYQFWPNGQDSGTPETPTATYPKFSGSVTVMEPDGDFLGGESNASPRAINVCEVEWPCTDKPTLAIS